MLTVDVLCYNYVGFAHILLLFRIEKEDVYCPICHEVKTGEQSKRDLTDESAKADNAVTFCCAILPSGTC